MVALEVILFSAISAWVQPQDPIDRLLAHLRSTGLTRVLAIVPSHLDEAYLDSRDVERLESFEDLDVAVESVNLDDEEERWIWDAENEYGHRVEAVLPLGRANDVYDILIGLQSVGFSVPVLLMQPNARGQMTLTATQVLPVLRNPLGAERPAKDDIAWLRTGEQLMGHVSNWSFTMGTPYAGSFSIETAHIAGIAWKGHDRDIIVTENGNKIIGSLLQEEVYFRDVAGKSHTLSRDRIARILFGPRDEGNKALRRNDVIVLKRGDVLTGKLPSCKVRFDESDGHLSVQPVLVRYADNRVLIRNMRSIEADSVESCFGFLEQGLLKVPLDLGPTASIRRHEIDLLSFQRGYGETIATADEMSFWPRNLVPRDVLRCDANVINGVGIELIRVEPGAFAMGWPGDCLTEPVHTVKITSPYYLGATEVTRAQWRAIMQTDPSPEGSDDLPVSNVTWEECHRFCLRLTEHEREAGRLPEGAEYRLPTEAQWECACRAGSGGALAGKLDRMAWIDANSYRGDYVEGRTQPHRVATKQPNAWGFFDMYGNVHEYCSDGFGWYSSEAAIDPEGPARVEDGDSHVMRGGCFTHVAVLITSAYRQEVGSDARKPCIGFRVALRLP